MGVLKGKVALITGGISGMGAATAKLFAAEGAIVVATGSRPETVDAAKPTLGAIEVIASDASDLRAVTALVADIKSRHGRIDVLFVNAGMTKHTPIEQVDEATYDEVFDVNVRGPFFLIKETVQVMPDGGSIILTSSIAHASAMPGMSVYAASKAALRSLGRTLAAELAPRRIRVNTISPGAIETPILGKVAGAANIDAVRERWAAAVPLGRVGAPEEIAAAALFLASEQASFITGADLPVDGGQLNLGAPRSAPRFTPM